MRTLWIMSGPSGAGKSTWIKEHTSFFIGSLNIVSRDSIRFSLLKEGEAYFSHEKEVFNIFIEEIKYSLNNFEHTIVDATHLNAASRWKLIYSLNEVLTEEIQINIIILEASLETCLENNEKREGLSYVNPSVVEKLWNSFKFPDFEEENYINKIFIYNVDKPGTGYRIIERGNIYE